MYPTDFIFQLLRNYLQFDQEQYTALSTSLREKLEVSQNKIVKFLHSPMVLILLPILLPLVKKAFDSVMERFIGDQNGDGDVDIVDALAALVDKHKRIAANG